MRTRKRKHERGAAPCQYCQDGRHYACRPRLDGTLCSCSCFIATGTRVRKTVLDADRTADGQQPLTTEQLFEFSGRRFKKEL
jgi:hypothetical protein